MLRFQKKYFLLTVLLFLIEVAIALFLNDRFVRPYVGDFLVVILLYCFFKSFLNTSVVKTAFAVLLIAYAIEAAQYFHLVNHLGLQHNRVMRTVIGSSAEWSDVLAYNLGITTVLLIERKRLNQA